MGIFHLLKKDDVEIPEKYFANKDRLSNQTAQSPESSPSSPQSFQDIDNMDGHTFEHWCANLLQRLGYSNVSVTPGSGDQGVDVIAEKGGVRFAIQCKCYSSNLGNTPVQEVSAGKSFYHCQVGIVMTNRYFTDGAKQLAEANGILLWDRDTVLSMAKKAYPNDKFTANIKSKPQSKKDVKKTVILFVALIVVFIFIANSFIGSNETREKDSNSAQNVVESEIVETIWGTDFASLDDFKYYVDYDNTIHLTDYIGHEKKIKISPTYKVDGIEMKVTALEGAFTLSKITSIIIPDSVESIANNEFNSCGVKYVYFPKSIKNFDGWSYFHDTQRLYYGGTEEEWASICTLDRSSVDIVRIIYEATIETLPDTV